MSTETPEAQVQARAERDVLEALHVIDCDVCDSEPDEACEDWPHDRKLLADPARIIVRSLAALGLLAAALPTTSEKS